MSIVERLRRYLKLRRRQAQWMSRNRRYRKFSIGRYSYGDPEVHFESSGAQLTVGQFCSFARGVKIFLGGEHRVDWVTTYPLSLMFAEAEGVKGHPATKGDIHIGNDVWVGHGATILSGVRIGNGAVIGAFAVVSKDVPPYGIAVGNPARVIRTRFPDAVIAQLLELAWWDWPIERILANAPSLMREPPVLAEHMADQAIRSELS